MSEIQPAADFRNARRRKTAYATERTDRLPPNSAEDGGAEQGVLGCALLSPNECLAQCIEKFTPGGEVFYDLRHQTIYDAMVAMADAREPIDIITLQQRLKDGKLLGQIGGIPYLNALQESVPSAANLSYYLDIVLEKYALRRLLSTCTNVVGRVYEHDGEVTELLDEAERDILAVGDVFDTNQSDTIRAAVNRSLETIEQMWSNPGIATGLTTGLQDLDRMTDGLKPGNMIVIAARPSMGKTSLAIQIAEHVSCGDQHLPVGVFSLEMTIDELTLRQVCSMARVNLRRVRDGFMTEGDFPRLTSASGRLAAAPLFIDDTGGLSIMQLRARARRMHQQHGIRLFVIDYLQLLHATSRKAQDNRVQEISEISGGIKELAKELNVPIIALSQLNRELEKDKNRKPRLSDLRESGAIEQDADIVAMLYKPEGEDEPSTEAEAAGLAVNLLISKQRNGPTGDVHLTFLKTFTRFESRARVSDEDVPPREQHQQEFRQTHNDA